MSYNFEYRDEKGFAVEVPDEDGEGSTYMGQVYGRTDTFQADNPLGAELQFRAQVDGEQDPDEEE